MALKRCDEPSATPHSFCCDVRRRNTKCIHFQQANGIGERDSTNVPMTDRDYDAVLEVTYCTQYAINFRCSRYDARRSPLSVTQSSLAARFSAPYVSSNEAKPFEGDWISTGACAPHFAACRNRPSTCHPRSVAPLGLVQGSESKVGYNDFS